MSGQGFADQFKIDCCRLVSLIVNKSVYIIIIFHISCYKWHLSGSPTGLQTKAVEVAEGGNVVLPCSLSQSVSQRVEGGKWKADHLPADSFPTLTYSDSKGLHWNGMNSSKVTFTSGQLSTNYDVTLIKVNTLHWSCFE